PSRRKSSSSTNNIFAAIAFTAFDCFSYYNRQSFFAQGQAQFSASYFCPKTPRIILLDKRREEVVFFYCTILYDERSFS
ncbi:MAG: hypothetical protein IKM24_02295, partial [Clostridia bacterium]|nr:hypothetical protein [Clostridia bacterium]